VCGGMGLIESLLKPAYYKILIEVERSVKYNYVSETKDLFLMLNTWN